MSFGLSFTTGLVTGVGLSYLTYKLAPTARRMFYQVYQAYSDPHDLGIPLEMDEQIILTRNGYYLAFDPKLCAARWTIHKLTRFSVTARFVKTRPAFEIDSDLDTECQIPSTFYEGLPWDRGHLVPSEDVKYSALSSKQTFLMSNVVPQNAKLNRNGWKSLEGNIRQWAEILGELHIVTGAFYGKRPRRLNQKVAIPKGLYKVIYSASSHRAIAFYYPNAPVNASEIWNPDYIYSIRDLENKLHSGDGLPYKFFSGCSDYGQVRDDCDLEYWLSLSSD